MKICNANTNVLMNLNPRNKFVLNMIGNQNNNAFKDWVIVTTDFLFFNTRWVNSLAWNRPSSLCRYCSDGWNQAFVMNRWKYIWWKLSSNAGYVPYLEYKRKRGKLFFVTKWYLSMSKFWSLFYSRLREILVNKFVFQEKHSLYWSENLTKMKTCRDWSLIYMVVTN